MIPPGATIGLLGGGQLGRMFAIEARKMGYRVHTYEPTPESPAGQVSDREFSSSYEDHDRLKQFAESVDVITYEFENIPLTALEAVSALTPLYPDPAVLGICQNREREKTYLDQAGYPVAPFRIVSTAGELADGVKELGDDVILKTADFGYDGKGQVAPGAGMDPAEVWEAFSAPRGVLEKRIAFTHECSVICARTREGLTATFPVAENEHRNHILDTSVIPARLPKDVQERASELAASLADQMKVVGLLTVELFVEADGNLIVNELAPRPHNSGHYSFDACITSQFEQQLRAVCGLPLGSVELLSPVVMVNLLGDVWQKGQPAWDEILKNPKARLHLYGKSEARPGRKMGHFCVLGDTAAEALTAANSIRRQLLRT
jgi:5-(carboxyamino)imidazole ribonucleotide synthase